MDQTNIDQIINKVLEQTFTRTQLIKRVRVLREFIHLRLFNIGPEETKMPLDKQIELFLSYNQKDQPSIDLIRQEQTWLVDLGEQFFNQFSPTNSDPILKQLEDYTGMIAPIIVYLPIVLPDREVLNLGNWFKSNLGPKTLFEIDYNGDLIAGCALSCKGIYKDYSLKSRFSDSQLMQQSIMDSLKNLKE